MIRNDEVIRIGQFAKPHGIKGEISLYFTNDIFDRGQSDYLVCDVDGILVPFFIEEYRFKNDSTALIKLEGVDTDADAREFTGRDVFYPARFAAGESGEDAYTWSYFIGFRVEDAAYGYLGVVADVDESTLNVLLQVERDGGELLVPAAEELIADIDHEARVIYMQLPDGFLDLENTPEIF